MVTLELARNFRQKNILVKTICLEGSPLADHLKQENLPILPISVRGFFRQTYQLSKILRAYPDSPLLCQHLHDLWKIVPVAYFSKNRLLGLSHTFLGFDKKDTLHTALYRRLDQLICLTESHRGNLTAHLNYPPEKIVVIPNEVDTRKFNPRQRTDYLYEKFRISPGKFLVGVVGRLDPQKGQDTAIQALSHLQHLKKDLHLLIVGQDTLNTQGTEKKLRGMIQSQGLEKMVTLAGFIEHTESLMASLDLVLVPSYHETFGRVVIEAMASGTPVVATRAGGIPDIIEDRVNGLLVPPQNPEKLAKAIEEVYLSPSLRASLSQAGVTTARNRYEAEMIENQLKETILDTKSDQQGQSHGKINRKGA